ncbi:MAG: C-GCAxxG-C-C family protein [Eubacterium sp.]|nr:C-GCAxxG-C-C family protein [Eubacterium sp.]
MIKYVDVYNAYGKDQPEDKQALYHMNCAEVLLRCGNAEFELGLPEETFKLVQGLGGGFCSGRTCGAFVGAAMALSARYAEDRPSAQEKAKLASKLLVQEYLKEFGSLDCDDIKAKYRDEVRACDPVKERAAKVMARVVAMVDAAKEN